MKLGTHGRPNNGRKSVQIAFDTSERFNCALNFTGFAYLDRTYGLIKNIISKHIFKVIVTDNDLIACDDYAECLHENNVVVFVFQGNPKVKGMNKPENSIYRLTNKAFDGCGASKQRLRNAQLKLKSMGYKTKFFDNEQKFRVWLDKQGNPRKTSIR